MNGTTSGTSFDDGWYLATIRFAENTHWLWQPVIWFTNCGVVLLGVALLAMLWWGRHAEPAVLARILWVGIAVVTAFSVDSALKTVVAEQRPCRTLSDVVTVLPCDGVTDYAFPSNHASVFAAFAVSTLLVRRAWGWVAVAAAALMSASRVYVGAHYPHDVVVGVVVGALLGVLGLVVHQRLVVIVERLPVGRFGVRR